jgi:hypothetical protein
VAADQHNELKLIVLDRRVLPNGLQSSLRAELQPCAQENT